MTIAPDDTNISEPPPDIRVKINRILAATFVAAPALVFAQTAAIPPVAEQIAAAVQPLPAGMRDGATVMGYKTANKLEVIRQGNNKMRCLALYVTRPDFHVACYFEGLEPFMARGRELRDGGMTNAAKVDSVRFAEIESGKIKMPAQGALYQITGKKDSWNPATNTVTGAQPMTVLYIPGATPETTGFTAGNVKGTPWLMYPGTPKAHVMIIGSMQ